MLMGTRLLKSASARWMKGSGVIVHKEACLCERTYLLLVYISFCMIFYKCVSSFVAVSVVCMCMESGKCTSANMIDKKKRKNQSKSHTNHNEAQWQIVSFDCETFLFFYVLQFFLLNYFLHSTFKLGGTFYRTTAVRNNNTFLFNLANSFQKRLPKSIQKEQKSLKITHKKKAIIQLQPS